MLSYYSAEEGDYYKELRMEFQNTLYWESFNDNFTERVKIYEKQLETGDYFPLGGQTESQEYTKELLKSYSNLISSGEKNKRECLKQLEKRLVQSPHMGREKMQNEDISHPEIEISEESLSSVYQSIDRTKEARFIERQKHVNEAAFSSPWKDNEVLNLLIGIKKHGENNWSEVCDKSNVQSLRTPNSLAYKWSQVKSMMLKDINHIYKKTHIGISKFDWLLGYIKKLENRCGLSSISKTMTCARGSGSSKMPMGPSYSSPAFSKAHQYPYSYESPRAIAYQGDKYAAHRGMSHLDIPSNQLRDQIGGEARLFRQDPNSRNEICREKSQNSIKVVLSENYFSCLGYFGSAINSGNFSSEDVKKYVQDASKKENQPVHVKQLFHLTYIEQRPSNSTHSEAVIPAPTQNREGHSKPIPPSKLDTNMEADPKKNKDEGHIPILPPPTIVPEKTGNPMSLKRRYIENKHKKAAQAKLQEKPTMDNGNHP